MKKVKIIFVIIFLLGLGYFGYEQYINKGVVAETEEQSLAKNEAEPQDIKKDILIKSGQTYTKLLLENGIDYNTAIQIFTVAEGVYDLTKIRAGKKIELTFGSDGQKLKELKYKIDSEDELIVSRKNKNADLGQISTSTQAEIFEWVAKIEAIPYEIKIVSAKAELNSSVYEDALQAGIDERAIIEFAYAFQWSIDFAMDPRVGDTFKMVYEKRYLDGEYIMPGRILGAVYNNQGEEYYAYYFEENEENKGYFDEKGNSVQKMFLKAPLEFKYISSGFTTGLRYIQSFNVSTKHRAIDYAASYGTPIRSVGDGRVIYAGWDGGYGNKISIRHNATYSTNYAHLSKYAVSAGEKVKQGQAIGYVGSTGFSTGPHLHFEMVKNGTKVNPLTEILPPGKPIAEENKERFFNEIDKYKKMLDKI